MFKKIQKFVSDDIWRLSITELANPQAFLIKHLKLLLLAIQGFINDLCILRASALTLYTLLSIVPIIAMLFGVAKGFGLEKVLEKNVLERVSEQDTMMIQLIEFSENLLASTKGGIVAGIGVVVLFWTIIKVIGNIEESFNHIWKVKQGRTLGRKTSDYLSLMLLSPILLISSSSLSVFVETKIVWLMEVINLPAFGKAIVFYGLSLLPLLLLWLLFSIIYILIPNTKISLKSGILSGIVTGTVFQLVLWLYLSLQIGVSNYNAIYGSFAALPLFVVWLQIVWFIVLFGAQGCYYHQNYEYYRTNENYDALSFRVKKVLALQVLHLIIQNFIQEKPPLNTLAISSQLTLSMGIVQAVLAKLMRSQLIIEIKTADNELSQFLPLHDSRHLSIAHVITALESCGNNQKPLSLAAINFSQELEDFEQLLQNSAQNYLLTEMTQKTTKHS